MRKSKLLILAFLLFGFFGVQAQKGDYSIDNGSSWQDRVYFGGGFGFSGDSGGTSLRLAPIVGYMLNTRVSVGIGANYEFYKSKFYNYEENRWGGMVFGRVNLIKQIFGHVEYSFMNYAYLGDNNDRRTIDRLPVGLGISQPIGPRSALNLLAAYDLLYEPDIYGPYNSPWIFTVYFSM